MSLLNPIALWGLLALLVPIILHLIHRAETKEQNWAAMEFLMEKEAHSVKRHSIREWLLLLSRILLILFLVLALAQPVGNLFSFQGQKPDTIFLLLDRSSDMGEEDENGVSRMDYALEEVVGSLRSMSNQTRLYLIDSATLEVLPILDVDSLALLSRTSVVDTPCSIPVLLSLALRESQNAKYGKSESWIVSSISAEKWKPKDAIWGGLAAFNQEERMSIRHVKVPTPSESDVRISVESAEYREGMVSLSVNIVGGVEGDEVVLSVKTKDGMTLTENITLRDGQFSYPYSFTTESERVEGEISATLSGDTNITNNRAYFITGRPRDFYTLIISEDKESSLSADLRHAVALSSRPYQKVKWAASDDFLLMDLSSIDVLVWAGEQESREVREKIADFVSQGAQAIIFPNPKREGHAEGWFLKGLHEAATEEFFTVGKWNEKEGPLRNARSSERLPIDRLQAITYADISIVDAYPLGHWRNGAPFLTRSYHGEGEIYAFSTLPHYSWSNLENLGLHLICLQRVISKQVERSGGGFIKTLLPGELPYLAGIKEEEGKAVAFNRAVLTEQRGLPKKELEELLKESGLNAEPSTVAFNKSWIIPFLYIALLAVMMEAIMLMKKRSEKEVSHG